MKPIIEINHLSKKYKYGESQPYYTLRDILVDVAKKPFKIFHNNQREANLRKDEFWALKDISFKVNQGEVTGLIGRNGAGKSTILKILSRITPPSAGQIILRGRVGSLLEVGTGFQQELTGRENIYLNGAILGMKRWEINNQFKNIVEFSEVGKFLDTPVKHYSSGMYMRLAFAVAAHLESEILLVDEVLAVGDSEFQKKCLGKMDNVAKKEGRTVLFVSHNLQAVTRLCKKTILLSKGSIENFGVTNEIVSKYIEGGNKGVKYGDQIPANLTNRPIITLLKINNNSDSGVGLENTLEVCVEYCLPKDISRVVITCDFYSESGIAIGAITDSDLNAAKYDKIRKSGKYRVIFRISKNVFLRGNYFIKSTIQTPDIVVYSSTDDVWFNVGDKKEKPRSKFSLNTFGFINITPEIKEVAI